MGSKRVVITGLGAITAIGKNVKEYQNSLFSGLSGCENILSFDTSKSERIISFFFSKPPGDESRQRRHSVALSENERLQMDKQAKMPHAKS